MNLHYNPEVKITHHPIEAATNDIISTKVWAFAKQNKRQRCESFTPLPSVPATSDGIVLNRELLISYVSIDLVRGERSHPLLAVGRNFELSDFGSIGDTVLVTDIDQLQSTTSMTFQERRQVMRDVMASEIHSEALVALAPAISNRVRPKSTGVDPVLVENFSTAHGNFVSAHHVQRFADSLATVAWLETKSILAWALIGAVVAALFSPLFAFLAARHSNVFSVVWILCALGVLLVSAVAAGLRYAGSPLSIRHDGKSLASYVVKGNLYVLLAKLAILALAMAAAWLAVKSVPWIASIIPLR